MERVITLRGGGIVRADKNKPEWLAVKLPKEAMSWSKRSKTDNSKSDAMGLGNDNEVEVRSREQGLDWVVNTAVSFVSSPSRLGRSGLVMCK